MWKDGKVTLDENRVTGIVGRRRDPVWGSMRYERSLREMGLDKKLFTPLVQSFLKQTKYSLQFSQLEGELIGRTGDFRRFYSQELIARKFLISNDVEITAATKKHIAFDHKEQIAWMESHLEIVQKALRDPLYISSSPSKKEERWAITQILDIDDEIFDLLVIGVRYGKETEFHRIITMFLADERFIFDGGKLRSKWKKIR